MKQIIFIIAVFFLLGKINAQFAVGDTIKVKGFKYGSNSRDSMIAFPPSNLTYEKVILKYNMRCKNGLVSNQSFPNQGCGEWDYSCNTYIVDSSKIENALNTAPSHVISNFTGTVFPYTAQTLFDYYNFTQTTVTINNIISENQFTVGVGSSTVANILKSNEKSGRSQILFTAAELISAGYSAGNIDGLILNVSNAGGGVNFFKVGIQHSSALSLNSGTLAVTGFTNVFNNNYAFVNGNNRIQFHTSFVWNGTSNVLIDFSFTNTIPTNPIVFNGVVTPSIMALSAKNNYALDLGSFGQVTVNPTALVTMSNEITVSLWAFGNSTLMPTNTAILYGYANNQGDRNLNIHMPWSDNNVYFDCGFANGGFDRINKVSVAQDQGGQWNNWAFTKNAVTGNMKIYLNGVLWHSGTGNTKTISLLNLFLGTDVYQSNNYKGKINELTIWNKELSLSDIQTWMIKPINPSHPFYSNLLAYYTMNEGGGLTVTDSKNNLVSNGVNLQWTYDRGDKLVRTFFESNLRPNVVFLRGSYNLTTNTLTVKDSIARNPNVVKQYSVVSNNTVVPMTDDLLNLVSTTNLFYANTINIYDGNTNLLTGTIAVTPQGTINITTLNYYKRYPFYNEIMSFVTPYGKGLNLGINGKTWYYDVTDFTPLFKGSKRLVMSLGGQYQEQMDVDFLFIVGTPPRNVLEFNQPWQGAARDGGASIGSIFNDTRFNALNIPLLSAGKFFKVRSTITGHGSEGEFQQNGGVVNHYLNVNGGANEYAWILEKDCGSNPIYPQGGTWLYHRQGWCPGQTSSLKEFDFTQYVIPGTTVAFDYQCSTAPVPSGDYRYIAAHQLITYGAINNLLDASVITVLSPSNKVVTSRTNPICSRPLILVQNTGSTTITNLTIDYWVNNSNAKQTYTWTGSLASMDTTQIHLPISALWQTGLQTLNNVFNVEIKKTNGVTDDYSFNNVYHSQFVMPAIVTSSFSIDFKTNNYPSHNNYKIVDENDNVVVAMTFTAPNAVQTDSYVLNGCYKFIVEDLGGDGLQWWANPSQGGGFCYLRDDQGNVLQNFITDFGNRFEYSFTTDSPLRIKENEFGSMINLYPNPSQGKFIVEGTEIENAKIKIIDVLGKVIEDVNVKERNKVEFDSRLMLPGIYFVLISKDNYSTTRKIIIY